MMPPKKGLREFFHHQNSLGRIFRNAGWMLAGKGAGAILSLFYLAAATRGLGPVQFGQFALILSLGQAISGFVSFQTWRIVIRFGSKHVVENQRLAFSRLAIACICLDCIAAIGGCVLAAVGVKLLGPYFGWTPALTTNALLYAFFVLLSVRSTAVGILRAYDKFRGGAAADAAMPVTRLIGALVVVAVGPTVTLFLAAWALSEVTTAIAYWWLVIRHRLIVVEEDSLKNLASVPGEQENFWKFVMLTNLGSTVSSLQQQLPVLASGLFAGPAAAGLFRFSSQLSQALARIGDMLARSMFAEFSRVRAKDGAGEAWTLLRGSTRLSIWGGIIILALVIIAGKPALYIISGQAYLPAYPLLVMLGVAAAIDLATVGFEPALMASGHAGQALAIRLISLIILATMLWISLPVMQERGAGLSMIAASFSNALLFMLATFRSNALRKL